eukprot:2043812-Amphidinium_carterae.1
MAIPPRLIEWPPQLCLPSVAISGNLSLCPNCVSVLIRPCFVNGLPADVGNNGSDLSLRPTASRDKHTGHSPRPT